MGEQSAGLTGEQLCALMAEDGRRLRRNLRKIRNLNPLHIAVGFVSGHVPKPTESGDLHGQQLATGMIRAARIGKRLLHARDQDMDVDKSDRLLTASQISRLAGLSRSAAYELMSRVPGKVRIGRSVRVPRAALTLYLETGGDPCPTKPTFILAERPGGAGSTTRTACEADKARTKRTDDWRRKLRDSLSASASSAADRKQKRSRSKTR
jgi:predicted DNA-binding transcriptional regulator AlpA